MIELNVLTDSLIPLEVMGGGSGGITPTGTKSISITQNGTTTEDVTNYADAEITVNVPQPSGTKSVSITSNGTTTEDVTSYASASINVNVPNSYSASDEGKVVDNGALVSQSSATYTENDTYDTTLINEVTVNVSGGGSEEDAIIDGSLSGSYENSNVTVVRQQAFRKFNSVTSVSFPNVTSIGTEAFRENTGIQSVSFPEISNSGSTSFYGCTNLANVYMPKLQTIGGYSFYNCALTSMVIPIAGGQLSDEGFTSCKKLKSVDCAPSLFRIALKSCSILDTLVVRSESVPPMTNITCFQGTPFASGGTGGTLYVPQALISSYQSATNWSTILGYANNQIKSIESTHTDPNAPIDLTLYYADGTLIS